MCIQMKVRRSLYGKERDRERQLKRQSKKDDRKSGKEREGYLFRKGLIYVYSDES